MTDLPISATKNKAITAFFTLVGAWYLTSILKLPVMLGLTIPFLGAWLWLRRSSANTDLPHRWLMTFFVALFLLGLIIQFKIYPVNVGVLMSAGTAMALVYSGALQTLYRKASGATTAMYQMDAKASIAYGVAFVLVLTVGTYMSINIGMAWDSSIEQQTLELAIKAMDRGLQGDFDYFLINEYGDRYYGIGFYLPAYLLHAPFAQWIADAKGMEIEAAMVLSRQLVVFWFFAASSILVARLTYWTTEHLRYSLLVSIAYLVYPYLLGHGMVNMKDSPFSVVWLMCVSVALKLFKEYRTNKMINQKWLIVLFALTAWLVGIRLSGVLFAIPLLTLIFFILWNDKLKWHFLCQCTPAVLVGAFIGVLIIAISYPVIWQNPYEFFNGIHYMGKHPWSGCTLTNGHCMEAQGLPSSYILYWLVVKLPVFALLALVFFPLILFKLNAHNKKWGLTVTLFLMLQVIFVIVLLIIKEVALYDEIRQILFLVPLIFIVSASILFYLNKLLAMVAISFSAIFFVIDNIKIFPYQLAWFNEGARLGSINNQYETDYWGTGLTKLAKQVRKKSHEFPKFVCIYSRPYEIFKPFMNAKYYPCHADIVHISDDTVRPYLYAIPKRSGLSAPVGCRVLHVETIKQVFSFEPTVVGEIGICE